MNNEHTIKKEIVSVLTFEGSDGQKRYMRSRLGTAFLDREGNGEISLVAAPLNPKAKVYIQDFRGRDEEGGE